MCIVCTFSSYAQSQNENAIPPQIKEIISVMQVNDSSNGNWTKMPDGNKVWKATYKVTNTGILQQKIQELKLSKGSQFKIFDHSMKEIYSSSTVYEKGFNLSDVLSGNVIHIEFIQPQSVSKRISEERITEPILLDEKKSLRPEKQIVIPDTNGVKINK